MKDVKITLTVKEENIKKALQYALKKSLPRLLEKKKNIETQ